MSQEAWDRLFLLGAVVFAVWIGWQLVPYVLR